MYTGSESGPCSSRKTHLINSSSADAIFACSGGKLISGKDISLGLALKSMTGSKSVVSLFKRFGHCIGDETVRLMDKSFEEAVNQKDTILPSHIQIPPNLSIGLAWDNFDIKIETLSGENTIHHLYGICYQNIMLSGNSQFDFDVEMNSFANMQVERKFKKGPNESKQEQLEPYHKKTKLSNFVTTEQSKIHNYMLTISFNMFDKIPTWTGWNVIDSTNLLQKQIVCYIKQMQLPPTRTGVVKETMKRSIGIAHEIKQRQAFVTYNLAIAKIAKRI